MTGTNSYLRVRREGGGIHACPTSQETRNAGRRGCDLQAGQEGAGGSRISLNGPWAMGSTRGAQRSAQLGDQREGESLTPWEV